MKENNEIDNLFEEALGNLQVEPDVASWTELSASLDAAASAGESGGKRRLFFYAFIGTVAALLAYLFFFNKNQTQFIDKKDTRQVEVPQQQKEQKSTPVQVAEPKKKVQNISDKSSAAGVVKKASPSNSTDNKTIKKVKSTASNSASTNPKRADIKESQNKINGTSFIVSEEVIATSVEDNSNKQAAANRAEETTAVVASSDNEVEIKAENMEEVTPEVETAKTNNVAIILEEAISEDNAIASKSEQEAMESSAPSPNSIAGVRNATALSIGVYGGPAFISSNETFVVDEGGLIYQTEKEQRIITPTIGLDINYHINNWFIRSGIAYAEYGENRTYSNKIEKHDTAGYSRTSVKTYYTYDTTGWITDPGNSSVQIPVYDAIMHHDTTYIWVSRDSLYYEHQNIYAQNRFRYIEIPLMLGYEYKFKNLGIELATGVSVGFRVNSSGKFMDSNKQLVDINSSNSPYSHTMMNYIFTAGVNYHFSDRFSIAVRPVYKTNLNSIIESGVGSDIRYNSFGVNLGINYIID
jgi:hypothetical protein